MSICPNGAVITQFRASVLDSQTQGNISVRLFRYELTDFVGKLLADVSTTGSDSNIQTLTDNSINDATIDNANYYYVIEVDTQDSNATGTHSLLSVRITYETDTVIN